MEYLRSTGNHVHRQELLMFAIGQQVTEMSAKRSSDSAASPDNKSRGRDVAELLEAWKEPDRVGPELLRDLGIALLVSVFVTFVIERYASNRLREHITYDVLSAAYAKVVPQQIYRQVADNVFRSDVYRRNWEVHIQTKGKTEDIQQSHVAIVRGTTTYEVENLNEQEIRFEVSGGIDMDVRVADQIIPRFHKITLTDQSNRQLFNECISDNDAKNLLKDGGSPIRIGEGFLRQQDQQIRFAVPVSIPGRGKIGVTFEGERAVHVPGNYVLYATAPADGIKIVVSGDQLHLEVFPLHPNRTALRRPSSNTWQFECGILPWQGFQLRCAIAAAREGLQGASD
jgi:hypothetical protein